MQNFMFGFFAGVILLGILTLAKPLWLTGVRVELVKQDHGYYDPKTGSFVLKECK